jgi:Uncharacterized FAD-dependent dehydrogenases
MFAAYELAEACCFRVALLDGGLRASSRTCPLQTPLQRCTFCVPCHIMYGVGAPARSAPAS